jgi:hypothetical protein
LRCIKRAEAPRGSLRLRQLPHRWRGGHEEPARRQGCQPGRDVPAGHHRALGLHHQHRGLHGVHRAGHGRRAEADRGRGAAGVAFVEQEMGKRFGNAADPLLLSVRSGARASMPGMMDTILNLGLNDEAVEGLAAQGRQCALCLGQLPPLRADVRRRGDGPEAGVQGGARPLRGGDRHDEGEGASSSTPSSTPPTCKELVARFKALIRARIGPRLPHRPLGAALGLGGGGVRELEQRARARLPRAQRHPAELGHGRQRAGHGLRQPGRHSATGVAFTRDAGTGEDLFNGEFLVNAQGEDVVAGIRTPQQVSLVGSRRWAELAQVGEAERQAKYPSLEELMPGSTSSCCRPRRAGEPLQATCRTWSSPSRKASCGCCRRATASAPARRWCASRWRCCSRA